MTSRAVVLLLCLWSTGCRTADPGSTVVHPLRLKPGQDVKLEIQRYVDEHGIEAGFVASCAGSLTEYALRFANRTDATTGSGHFEIVSLSGTVSRHGSHLHLAVANETGRTIGGHLMDHNLVYTTAEIVLVESRDHVFTRAEDGTTPWKELQVRRR